MSRHKIQVNDTTSVSEFIATLDFEELISCISELADLEHKVNLLPKKVFGNYVSVYLREVHNIEIKQSTHTSDGVAMMKSWHGTVIDDIAKIMIDLNLIGIEKVEIKIGGTTTRPINHYKVLYRG